MRPGYEVLIRDTPQPRSTPTDTGVWFAAGETEKGPTDEAVLVRSMTEFTTHFGSRQSFSVLYDAMETFFREGGNRAYVARVVGPTPVLATATLDDADTDPTLRIDAVSPGAWGSSLNVAVTAGDAAGEFKLVITHDTLGTLETSPSLADKTAAVAWAANSDYIRAVDIDVAQSDPAVVSATSLASGDDDRSNIGNTQWVNALNLFTADLGPGQVSVPGRTTSQGHADLMSHADAHNRIALLDYADTATKSTLLTSAAANDGLTGARSSAAFVPWVTVPGLTAGTTRTVPSSALMAGLMARNDAIYSPNIPAAGELGQARWAIGISQANWTDADRQDLNDAGVNVIRSMLGGVRAYGYRTVVDASADAAHVNLANARLQMAIVAKAGAIAERYVFRQIDGRGITISQFGGELTAMLLPYWENGSLYGVTADDAFAVDVSESVNTPETIAALELHAVLGLRMSPFAELVVVEIVKVAVTEAVA